MIRTRAGAAVSALYLALPPAPAQHAPYNNLPMPAPARRGRAVRIPSGAEKTRTETEPSGPVGPATPHHLPAAPPMHACMHAGRRAATAMALLQLQPRSSRPAPGNNDVATTV
ncbi:hypothetical protein ZWY2020_030607 [Hordeum vulgare]|nr:hypothetical protein ZWY2020_030607 [Hordeum vulgare]